MSQAESSPDPDIPEEAFAAAAAVPDKGGKEASKAAKVEAENAKALKQMAKDEGPSPEQEKKRIDLMQHLMNMGKHPRFEGFLKEQGFKLTRIELEKKSIPQLESLTDEIKIAQSARYKSNFLTALALGGIKVIETIGTRNEAFKVKFDITGIHRILESNDQFLDTLAQLEMNWTSYSTMGPEVGMVVCIINAMVQANNANYAAKVAKATALAAVATMSTAAPAPTFNIPEAKVTIEEETFLPEPPLPMDSSSMPPQATVPPKFTIPEAPAS